MIEMMSAPTVHEVESRDGYGRFEIGPLEPGFGVTLGNSLRRVLLSSLPGAAVTSVSIDGVAHEFTPIPHVKEDVTQVLLNLKGLNVVCHSDSPVRMILDARGPKVVTAQDIDAPSDVEIRNPDLVICTLDGPRSAIRMELVVERGKGYATAERNKREGQPIGVIPLDSIFSPVRKANYVVEKTRVGQETEWDRLLVEVWTDGTMEPSEAIARAAAIFSDHLRLFVNFSNNISIAEATSAGGDDLAARLADVPVERLDLSMRSLNCLKANDITTVGQLAGMKLEELLTLRNFGQKSLDEIRERLVEKELVTPDEVQALFPSARGEGPA